MIFILRVKIPNHQKGSIELNNTIKMPVKFINTQNQNFLPRKLFFSKLLIMKYSILNGDLNTMTQQS